MVHCPPGAELGSRNGSAAWPAYFFDSLPSILDTGRGSPTGVTSYQGGAFPAAYDDNLLLCDWSQGRILAVALARSGASYQAEPRVLVSGQPLNCTAGQPSNSRRTVRPGCTSGMSRPSR